MSTVAAKTTQSSIDKRSDFQTIGTRNLCQLCEGGAHLPKTRKWAWMYRWNLQKARDKMFKDAPNLITIGPPLPYPTMPATMPTFIIISYKFSSIYYHRHFCLDPCPPPPRTFTPSSYPPLPPPLALLSPLILIVANFHCFYFKWKLCCPKNFEIIFFEK